MGACVEGEVCTVVHHLEEEEEEVEVEDVD